MASNYWDSTQALHWTFTKDQLNAMRKNMREANKNLYAKYDLPDPIHMNIFIQQRRNRTKCRSPFVRRAHGDAELVKLGRRMNLRQQALATAQVYVRRFYSVIEIRRTNPYLLMTTAIYLACKMEECPVHIRLMLAEASRQWPGAWDI